MPLGIGLGELQHLDNFGVHLKWGCIDVVEAQSNDDKVEHLNQGDDADAETQIEDAAQIGCQRKGEIRFGWKCMARDSQSSVIQDMTTIRLLADTS